MDYTEERTIVAQGGGARSRRGFANTGTGSCDSLYYSSEALRRDAQTENQSALNRSPEWGRAL